MKQHFTDEKTGISYTLQGAYYLPDLALSAQKDEAIGIWGRQHLRYIKQYRKILYTDLLTSGKLNVYLVDIDRQAENLFFGLVKQLVTEKLKAENQMEWVARMNNLRHRVVEIVNSEIIFG